MKRKRIIIQIVMTLCTVFSACKKDVLETSEVLNPGAYASLQDFYEQHGAGAQTFFFNPTENYIIVGDSGTMIGIHANSLVDSNGLPPVGQVQVTLKEIYGVKSMVLSHTPTTSNGAILQSGGMFYLEFTANNIHYKPDTVLGALMPSDSAISGMKIYYGFTNEIGFNWMLDSNSVVVDSMNTYAFSFDSLGYGWINVDQLYSISNPVNVNITPVITAERNETVDFAVYLILPSINSVMNVINTSVPENIVAANIPAGMQAVAVVIGVGRVTKNAYFGKTNFTITYPQNINISVIQTSDQQILNSLSNL
jgi:hypothetical protein